jgi:hypothetical protein
MTKSFPGKKNPQGAMVCAVGFAFNNDGMIIDYLIGKRKALYREWG